MNFSQALECVKNGMKISRSGWNGKEQYIEIGFECGYRNFDGVYIAANSQCLVFHGTSGCQVGWCASQGDMLASDWIARW